MLEATPIEIAWTGIVGSAGYPTFMNVYNQYREWRALDEMKVNHGAQIVSQGYLVVEIIVGILLSLFISVGLLAMFSRPQSPMPEPRVIDHFIVGMLFLGGVLVTMRCWLVYLIRHKHTRTATTERENP